MPANSRWDLIRAFKGLKHSSSGRKVSVLSKTREETTTISGFQRNTMA